MTRQNQGRRKAQKKSTSSTPRVLLGVRVPEKFHHRVLLECRRQEVTLQKLVTSALRHYFKTSEDTGEEVLLVYNPPPDPDRGLKQIWEEYLDKMPLERVALLCLMMTLDLVFPSKAAKPSKKKIKLLKAYGEALKDYSAHGSIPDLVSKAAGWGVDVWPWTAGLVSESKRSGRRANVRQEKSRKRSSALSLKRLGGTEGKSSGRMTDVHLS